MQQNWLISYGLFFHQLYALACTSKILFWKEYKRSDIIYKLLVKIQSFIGQETFFLITHYTFFKQA